MMKRMIVLAWAVALFSLSACNRATPALPAPAAPNVEWAPLQAAAEAKVKVVDPDVTLLEVSATEIDVMSSDVNQRLLFRYLTSDRTLATVAVLQEKGAIRTTELFTTTLNIGLENGLRSLSDAETPFPTTPDEMRDYQRRAAKIRLSPREALRQAVAEERAVTPNQCSLTSLWLTFTRALDTPVWTAMLTCKPFVIIFYDVNAETGQLISRKEVK